MYYTPNCLHFQGRQILVNQSMSQNGACVNNVVFNVFHEAPITNNKILPITQINLCVKKSSLKCTQNITTTLKLSMLPVDCVSSTI